MTRPLSYGEKRLHKPFVTFKSYKNLVSAHFTENPYMSSKSKRKISGVKIGYMLRETDSEIVTSIKNEILCTVFNSSLILKYYYKHTDIICFKGTFLDYCAALCSLYMFVYKTKYIRWYFILSYWLSLGWCIFVYSRHFLWIDRLEALFSHVWWK